jgi:hypothetical protein
MDYQDVIDRVEAAASLVVGPDRQAGERVVAIARQLEVRQRNNSSLVPHECDAALRRELSRHYELLGRRGAKALPLSALARTLLADLGGTRRDFEDAISDCKQKLLMFGL